MAFQGRTERCTRRARGRAGARGACVLRCGFKVAVAEGGVLAEASGHVCVYLCPRGRAKAPLGPSGGLSIERERILCGSRSRPDTDTDAWDLQVSSHRQKGIDLSHRW